MNEIETAVLDMIGENTSSPDVFTDDAVGMVQIRDSINDAIQEISILTGSVRRRIRIPLASGKIFYELSLGQDIWAWPLSCWMVNQKRRIPQKDVFWLQKANPRWMLGSGPPFYYYLIGYDKIGIDRGPTSDSDILEFDCVLVPARYAEDYDRVKVRNEFKWATVHYAVSEFWASRGDAREATLHWSEYAQHIQIQELYPQTAERPWMYRTEKKEQ